MTTTLTSPLTRRTTIWDSPTVLSTDTHGLRYRENSADWKRLCEPLPCFRGLEWPGYDAVEVSATVRGEEVVIQLWRGLCQKFLLLTTFPGGVGAEVGIYRRQPGRPWPRSLPFLPPLARPAFQLRHLLDPDTELWWPAPDLQTELTFDFVNPLTNQSVFTAGAERTYWLCKWMDERDYQLRYRDLVGTANVPVMPNQFILDFSIDGRRWRWHPPTAGTPQGAVEELSG